MRGTQPIRVFVGLKVATVARELTRLAGSSARPLGSTHYTADIYITLVPPWGEPLFLPQSGNLAPADLGRMR